MKKTLLVIVLVLTMAASALAADVQLTVIVPGAWVDIAIEAGADAVKFQTFLAEKGISVRAPKANYQLKLTPEGESQFDMIKRLELSYDAHVEIINYCNAKGIKFLSTACDLESVDLLEKFDIPIYKIASCDLINIPLIRYIDMLRKKVILSTGMSTLA